MLRFIRFIKIMRLLRLAKLKKIFDKIEEFIQLSTTIAAIMSFLKLSVFVLYVFVYFIIRLDFGHIGLDVSFILLVNLKMLIVKSNK